MNAGGLLATSLAKTELQAQCETLLTEKDMERNKIHDNVDMSTSGLHIQSHVHT